MEDDHQPDYNTGPDPSDDDEYDDDGGGDDDDEQEYFIPDNHGPPPDDDFDMPGIQDSGETQEPRIPSTPFSDADVPIGASVDLGRGDDPPPRPDQTSERIRVQRTRDRFLFDSTGALPKAQAKVTIKKPTVQLLGHVQQISVPRVKPVEDP